MGPPGRMGPPDRLGAPDRFGDLIALALGRLEGPGRLGQWGP